MLLNYLGIKLLFGTNVPYSLLSKKQGAAMLQAGNTRGTRQLNMIQGAKSHYLSVSSQLVGKMVPFLAWCGNLAFPQTPESLNFTL